MRQVLSLVVLRDKLVADFIPLGEYPDCFEPIIPKRKPQQATPNSKIWIVNMAKRQALVKHIDKVYERLEAMWARDEELYRSKESLCAWFGVQGVANRWLGDQGVVWGLYLSDNDIQAGEPLKA